MFKHWSKFTLRPKDLVIYAGFFFMTETIVGYYTNSYDYSPTVGFLVIGLFEALYPSNRNTNER